MVIPIFPEDVLPRCVADQSNNFERSKKLV